MKNIFKIVFFAVSLMFLTHIVSAKENAVNIFADSRDAPQRKIMHESGKSYSLGDFKGQFVVAVFWSKNCGPCLKEMKDLNVFYKNALPENIRLILISPKSEWHSAVEQRLFLKKYGASDVEFYTDKKGELAADFGIFTTPHTVLINEDGQEIGRIRGTAKWADKRVLAYIKSLQKP
ncbi:MAG: TlpA family protein disulfide reductase [Alphaproteobacteria bacterium]|nr:TlpA family protein disulfide reductase [Alphaproteobacteria bacterium]